MVDLNAVASRIADRPITVLCDKVWDRPDHALGYTVAVGGVFLGVIHLPAQTCDDLSSVNTHHDVNPLEFLTLNHELQHIVLKETVDECRVEAAAVANIWPLVKLFHLAKWKVKFILDGMKYDDAMLPLNYRKGCDATPNDV